LQLAVTQRDEALAKAHHFWLQSCADHDQVQAITRSTSWRITAPLRWTLHTSRALPVTVVRKIKSVPRRVAGVGVRFILARPALRDRLYAGLKRFPRLFALLKRIAHSRGLLGSPQQAAAHSDVPAHLSGLSAQARQVYHDLKKAIDQKDLR
jgi:O-antigen chain-terminating methyltransferase